MRSPPRVVTAEAVPLHCNRTPGVAEPGPPGFERVYAPAASSTVPHGKRPRPVERSRGPGLSGKLARRVLTLKFQLRDLG